MHQRATLFSTSLLTDSNYDRQPQFRSRSLTRFCYNLWQAHLEENVKQTLDFLLKWLHDEQITMTIDGHHYGPADGAQGKLPMITLQKHNLMPGQPTKRQAEWPEDEEEFWELLIEMAETYE